MIVQDTLSLLTNRKRSETIKMYNHRKEYKVKTYLKYVVIGFIVAFLGSNTTANALMSHQRDAVTPYSREISADIVITKEYCVYLPYSKQKIKDFFDNKMGFFIAYTIKISIPASVNEGNFVNLIFFDVEEKGTQACIYYQTI